MSESPDDPVRRLDRAPRAEAVEHFRTCCAAGRWVEAMADRRPFGDVETLRQAAAAEWAELGPSDWREAIEHHPRLGGSDLESRRFESTRSLSESEQAGVLSATGKSRTALMDAQREYEERFGFIFLIRASGRSADEILAELRRRMKNDPETEFAVAARELEEIARLRLEQQFGDRGNR